MVLTDLMIGGIAGALSRTLTAPLELNKIQKQNHFMPNSTIKDVLRKEGVRYLWKGNGVNCMRVFPQYAINYTVYRNVLKHMKLENKTFHLLCHLPKIHIVEDYLDYWDY